jgi:hypothetical protein
MRVWAKVNPCGVWLGSNSKFMNFRHPSRSVAMLLLLAVDLIQCISPGLYVYDLFSHSLHDACDPHDPSRPSYHGKLSSQSESPSSNMLSHSIVQQPHNGFLQVKQVQAELFGYSGGKQLDWLIETLEFVLAE